MTTQTWRGYGPLIQKMAAEEQDLKNGQAELPEGCFGWFPYPISQFIMYLADALTASIGGNFLDVGAGTGTKCVLAEEIFGLDAAGIEIDPHMLERAHRHGRPVLAADARTWDGYGRADIVFVNRPCSDQETLERHIMAGMSPGAVLISVNGLLTPSQEGWSIVAEEFGAVPACGVWVKT